jgi:Uma2 family endonuclease
MAVEPRLMTAEELLAMPDDGMRHELVDGELRTMTPTRTKHGRVAGAIHGKLADFARTHRLGEVLSAEPGFLLRRDPDMVRSPDVAFVLRERLTDDDETYFEGAPDLVVEVVSPGDTATEVQEKVEAWLRAGARAVWVVYPTGPRLQLHVPDGSARTLGPDDEVDGGEALPGFRMRLRDLLDPYGP